MTFVGKILVILNMFFAVCFLAVAGLVMAAGTNWKDATFKARDQIKKLQAEVTTAKAAAEAAKSTADAAVASAKGEVQQLNDKLKSAADANAQLEREKTDAVTRIETVQQNLTIAQTEADARVREAESLRKTLDDVQQQANRLKIEQTDLNTKIRELEVEQTALKADKKSLLTNLEAYASFLASKNIDVDINQVKRLQVLPDVEGEVSRVDPGNRRIEITIGKDDGLVPGHVLEIYRLSPQPEYIGKIRILQTEPDKAVGDVVGRTYQGKKIQEGDRVSNKIRPRG